MEPSHECASYHFFRVFLTHRSPIALLNIFLPRECVELNRKTVTFESFRCEPWAEGDRVDCALLTLRVVLSLYGGTSKFRLPRRRRGPRLSNQCQSPCDWRISRVFTTIVHARRSRIWCRVGLAWSSARVVESVSGRRRAWAIRIGLELRWRMACVYVLACLQSRHVRQQVLFSP
jgi:hypothetical protein